MLLPVLLVLTAGLIAGCGGGGEQQPEGGSQDAGGGQQKSQSKKEARETKIGVGNVVSVKADRRRMIVQPPRQAEEAERLSINVRKNAQITLGGKKAEMGDVAEGQQAQVEYLVKNDVNRAISVQLFPVEDQQEQQDQPDQPSGEEGASN